MKSLSETWFAEGYIDFELKKYTLLAYLQHVNSYFNQNKLYGVDRNIDSSELEIEIPVICLFTESIIIIASPKPHSLP